MGLDMIVTSIILAIWFFLPIGLIAYYLFNDKDSVMYKRPRGTKFFMKNSLLGHGPDY